MKKYPSGARTHKLKQGITQLLVWCVLVLPIPGMLFLLTPLGKEALWAISISWTTAMTVAAVGYRRAVRLREEDLKSAVFLYVNLRDPNESRYGNSFQLEYENRGSIELEGRIDLSIYPMIRGRSDEWNPAFDEEYRSKITSLGPFETHEVILTPSEVQTYPYSNQVVLPAIGLHGYVPHWLTLQAQIWPRGRPELFKEYSVIFYVLWFCGQESRFPGTWMIDRNRIRTTRHSKKRGTIDRWRQHIEPLVEDVYKQAGLQDYIDMSCRNRAGDDGNKDPEKFG